MSIKQRKTEQEKTQSGTPTGINNNFIIEKFSRPRERNSSVTFEGKNNSFIKLSRDQDASGASGAGGKGYTQCGAIDLVAGLNSTNSSANDKRDPNFFTDASRLYLTQKGKINHYFGVAKGSSISRNENWDAGIGIKSDNVNIIGKKHIKLVTSVARINTKEKSAHGGVLDGAGKIDFIAGNYSGKETVESVEFLGIKVPTREKKVLQPLVKGDNLLDLLNNILNKLEDIQGAILDNRLAITKTAVTFQSHMHVGGAVGPAVTVLPSPNGVGLIPEITKIFSKIPEDLLAVSNIATLRENYLTKEKAEYINSRHVSTT